MVGLSPYFLARSKGIDTSNFYLEQKFAGSCALFGGARAKSESKLKGLTGLRCGSGSPGTTTYVASSGTGVGQALTWSELGSLYRTAVDTCKGEIVVGAKIPEQYSAKLTIEHAQFAVDCRVDVVCIYGPDGRHASGQPMRNMFASSTRCWRR